MPVRIRTAESADVGEIREVATQAWYAAHEPIVGTEAVDAFLDEHYDPASFRARIDRADTVVDVAATGGNVVGFVLASPADDEGATFSLGQIYVAPDRWGEGIGRELLGHVEEKVRQRGGERITLGVVAENARAVDFYEAADYRRTDEFYDDRVDATGYTYCKVLD